MPKVGDRIVRTASIKALSTIIPCRVGLDCNVEVGPGDGGSEAQEVNHECDITVKP